MEKPPAPQRILVSVAHPGSGAPLLELGLLLRDRGSYEPLYPLTVVPDDPGRAPEFVATAEKMLIQASSYAASANVPVVPVTRVDHNFASGISRGATEVLASTLILGWERKPPRRFQIFGTVLDQVLELTKQEVWVARIGPPLNTTRRVTLVVPDGADHMQGFAAAIANLKRLAHQLAAPIHVIPVGPEPELYVSHLERIRPDVPVEGAGVPSWERLPEYLAMQIREDDLVVLLSARKGSVAWSSELELLPRTLGSVVPESLIVVYPSETPSAVSGVPIVPLETGQSPSPPHRREPAEQEAP